MSFLFCHSMVHKASKTGDQLTFFPYYNWHTSTWYHA
jgi:hypothetical protein